jgi:hypothetical protein
MGRHCWGTAQHLCGASLNIHDMWAVVLALIIVFLAYQWIMFRQRQMASPPPTANEYTSALNTVQRIKQVFPELGVASITHERTLANPASLPPRAEADHAYSVLLRQAGIAGDADEIKKIDTERGQLDALYNLANTSPKATNTTVSQID